MIIIPVENQHGQKLFMLWITPDAIARLQRGQACTLVSPQAEERTGVAGVELRFAENELAAANAARKLAGESVSLNFELLEIDRSRRTP